MFYSESTRLLQRYDYSEANMSAILLGTVRFCWKWARLHFVHFTTRMRSEPMLERPRERIVNVLNQCSDAINMSMFWFPDMADSSCNFICHLVIGPLFFSRGILIVRFWLAEGARVIDSTEPCITAYDTLVSYHKSVVLDFWIQVIHIRVSRVVLCQLFVGQFGCL